MRIGPADEPAGSTRFVTLPKRIKWQNYFDYGDPVGFRLDEARRMLQSKNCGAFEFHPVHDDHGYSRSWMPGKAHIDYWTDPALFTHFIDAVVQEPDETDCVPPPASRPLSGPVAASLPYCFSFVLHLVAILILMFGLAPAVLSEPRGFLLGLAPALALFVMTFAVRIPQLVVHEWRWVASALACALVAGLAIWSMSDEIATDLSERLGRLLASGESQAGYAKWLLLVVAVAVTVIGWIGARTHFARGRSLLVGSGVLLCFTLAASGPKGFPSDLSTYVAFALFVGSWWLGIIILDLAFVWHRYIRNAVSVRTLRAWQRREDARPDPFWGLGNPARSAQGPGRTSQIVRSG